MHNKKYIAISLAAILLVITGCTKVNEEVVPANAEFVSETLTSETEPTVQYTTEASKAVTSATAETTDTTASDLITEESISIDETEEEPQEEVNVESISLSTYDVSVYIGSSKMPIVTMLPENAPDKSEIWTSSNTDIAVVNELGNITGISEGECIVKVVSAANPEVYAEVNVTVKKADDGLTYINGILIANKTYSVPQDYNPGVNDDAQKAFNKMQADAYSEGLNIYISSAFRSYEYQSQLYQRYVNRDGKAEADRYSARPGHSEHQTGLAFDLNTIDSSFADTAEGKWVAEHCYEYGFIIRYPADKEAVTGFLYEPWHIRYLGTDIAKDVYDSGLCLEEYLGIDSVYNY